LGCCVGHRFAQPNLAGCNGQIGRFRHFCEGTGNHPFFLPRHSREGGNPEACISRCNASQFFDWQPFWLEKTNWIPAFAGMTMKILSV
jgi:hypothetical protein